MAKSGASSSVVGRDSSRSAGTRGKLVEAAIETLQAEGFAGASARAIAQRAGVDLERPDNGLFEGELPLERD